MKTKLEISEEFKPYFIKEKDLRNELGSIDFAYQWLFKFENNYGASIIKHYGSYGYEDNLFELAVIKYVDDGVSDRWKLCYDTEITDDVVGYLTNEEVMEYLDKIMKLQGEK